MYTGYQKPCKHVWLYFIYLTCAHIHQEQVTCWVPFSTDFSTPFSTTPVFWFRLLWKAFYMIWYIYKNDNIVLSIQCFQNQFSLLKAFSFLVTVYTPQIKTSKIWDNAWGHFYSQSRDLKVDGCQLNLYFMLRDFLFFIGFTTSILNGIFWWTDRVITINSKFYNTTTLEP